MARRQGQNLDTLHLTKSLSLPLIGCLGASAGSLGRERSPGEKGIVLNQTSKENLGKRMGLGLVGIGHMFPDADLFFRTVLQYFELLEVSIRIRISLTKHDCYKYTVLTECFALSPRLAKDISPLINPNLWSVRITVFNRRSLLAQ